MPEGCTVELGQDEILIRDYWRSIDSYTTAYASARLRGDKLVVHSRRSCAADEIYMTGSDVLLRVKLPKGIKGTELKKIIVRSKGETWRETTRVSFP